MIGGYWNVKTRRKFFDEFAREQGFDPLHPENWYQFTTADILKKKVHFQFNFAKEIKYNNIIFINLGCTFSPS